MKVSIKKYLSDDKFKYFLLFIIMFLSVFNYSFVKQIHLWIGTLNTVVLILTAIFCFFFCNITKKDFTFIFIAYLLLIITQNRTYDDWFETLFLLMILCKSLKTDKVLKITFIGLSLALALIILGSFINVLPSTFEVIDGVSYYNFSFTHRSIVPLYSISLILILVFLDSKMKYFYLLIPLTIGTILISYYIFHVRTVIIVQLLVLFYELYIVMMKKLDIKFMHILITWVFKYSLVWIILLALFTLVTTLLFNLNGDNNSLIRIINELFTGRLSLQKQAFESIGFPLVGVGRMASLHTLNYRLVLDNSLLFVLYDRGLLLEVFLITFYFQKANKEFRVYKDYRYLLILLVKLIEAISQPYLFSFSFTPFLVLGLKERSDEY